MSSSLDSLLILVGIAGGLVAFVGFWLGVCWLLGLASGWRGLAARHRASREPPLGSRMTSGMLGVVSYNGVLEIGADVEGLDLRVMAMFRAGHPPLRIPWSVIRVEGEHHGIFIKQTKIRLGEGGPMLRIPTSVWREVTGLQA